MIGWTSRKSWYVASVGAAILVVAMVVALESPRPGSISPPHAPRVHGKFADALDSAGAGGTSIQTALARLERKVDLPDTAVVGDVEKVVVDDMDRVDPKEFGLLVRFASGIKLKVEPGRIDFLDSLEKTKGAKFDGSTQPYRIETIAGRKTWVAEGGVQALESGGYAVPTLITWNATGYTYTLEAGSESVSLADLRAAAESIR